MAAPRSPRNETFWPHVLRSAHGECSLLSDRSKTKPCRGPAQSQTSPGPEDEGQKRDAVTTRERGLDTSFATHKTTACACHKPHHFTFTGTVPEPYPGHLKVLPLQIRPHISKMNTTPTHIQSQHQRSRMGNRSLKGPRILQKHQSIRTETGTHHNTKQAKWPASMTLPLRRHPSLSSHCNHILVRSLENRRRTDKQQGHPGTDRDQKDVPAALPNRYQDVIRVSTDQLRGREPRRPREAQRREQRPPPRCRDPPQPAAWRTARRRSQWARQWCRSTQSSWKRGRW